MLIWIPLVLNEKNNIHSFIEEHFSEELKLAFDKEKNAAIASAKKELEQQIKEESLKLEREAKRLSEVRLQLEADTVNGQEKIKATAEFVENLNSLFENIKEDLSSNRQIIKADSVQVFATLMNKLYGTSEKIIMLSNEINAVIDGLNTPIIKMELSSKHITGVKDEISDLFGHLALTYNDELQVDEAIIHTGQLRLEISSKNKKNIVKSFLQGLIDEI